MLWSKRLSLVQHGCAPRQALVRARTPSVPAPHRQRQLPHAPDSPRCALCRLRTSSVAGARGAREAGMALLLDVAGHRLRDRSACSTVFALVFVELLGQGLTLGRSSPPSRPPRVQTMWGGGHMRRQFPSKGTHAPPPLVTTHDSSSPPSIIPGPGLVVFHRPVHGRAAGLQLLQRPRVVPQVRLRAHEDDRCSEGSARISERKLVRPIQICVRDFGVPLALYVLQTVPARDIKPRGARGGGGGGEGGRDEARGSQPVNGRALAIDRTAKARTRAAEKKDGPRAGEEGGGWR